MIQGVSLRAATSRDVAAIANLHANSWRYAYRDALDDAYLAAHVDMDRLNLWTDRLSTSCDGQHVVVAENSDHIVGFACVYLGDDTRWGALLDNIHVVRSAHRGGVGSALLANVVEYCLRLSSREGLYLWVLQSNTTAQSFYLRHGAVNVGTDVWNAPGGNRVPRFRFAWSHESLQGLL